MYNLNGSMSGAPMIGVDGCAVSASPIQTSTASSIVTTSNGQLTVGTTCNHTPLTPEILNSVMAMTNPLEYSFSANNPTIISTEISQPSTDSHSSSSGSPFESPKTSTFANGRIFSKEATTPTVQQTCSQLIKTSLKLSLEMKRKTSTTDSSSIDMPMCKKIKEDIDTSDDETSEQETRPSRSSNPLLTNEDEDRRRRRRERNKIAATKCRMKKRERTINLVGESETLDAQNIELKQQLRNLEIERRTLTEMLKAHSPNCMRGTQSSLPVLNISIEKFLNQIGLGQQNQQFTIKTNDQPQSTVTKTRNTAIKITPQHKLQKIPSVNTLKFNGRHQNQTNESLITNSSTTIISPMTMAITTTSNCIPTQQMNTNLTPISECKPLPSIDMGYCEGRKETMTPTNNYCKSMISSSSDCYAMSSPDSGFIKSPVDMGGNYGPLTGLIIKPDYIPNCDADLLNHHRLDVNDSTNGDGSIDFILKSELVDLNDSPYTTVQSADRFLFDEVAEAFDPDMDGTNPNHSHSSIIIGDHSSAQLHALNKDHLLLNHVAYQKCPHSNNNNNNNNNMNNNNNNNNHQSHHNGLNLHTNLMNGNDHLNNFVNNSNVISSGIHPHSSSIIEFNSCQQFMDNNLLLKSDFLSQNCEFLSLANESGDSQFTTDLDSGLTTTTTYTNITNGNGCLA